MAAYASREDVERAGLVVSFEDDATITLGGVSLPLARPVTDPYLDRIGETIYGVRRGADESAEAYRARCRSALSGPVRQAPSFGGWMEAVTDVARIASDAILRSMDSSPRAQAKARAARFESQLPGLLDAAPKGARDGFGRRQGAGWDAWLRALADVRERVVCGDIRAQHASTTLVAAYAHWHVLMGTEWDACDAPVVDCNGTVIA